MDDIDLRGVVGPSFRWATERPSAGLNENISETRDVFRARLDRYYRTMATAAWPEENSALLTAAIGEIGNNCFDHNLGQWRDDVGCWFEWGFSLEKSTMWAVVSDRGQGVRASLQRADPSISSDQGALEVAFSKVLSGRSPEKRGNGLKFVRQIVNGDSKRGLLFLSGESRMIFGNKGPEMETLVPKEHSALPGTWALLLEER